MSLYLSPATVRRTFAFILAHAIPSEPQALYNEFIEVMTQDFMREYNSIECTTYIKELALNDIDHYLQECDRYLTEFPMLPQLPPNWQRNNHSNQPKDSLIIDYYSAQEKQSYRDTFDNNYRLAWPEQKIIIDTVIEAIDNQTPTYVLIDASAGTGKTFVMNTLQDYLQYKFGTNEIHISVSSTGISADLLQYGHTAHFTFALPTNNTDPTTIRSQLDFNSERVNRLRRVKVLFWDEFFTIQ